MKYEKYDIAFFWYDNVENVTLLAKHQRHLIQVIKTYIKAQYPYNKGWSIVPDYLDGKPPIGKYSYGTGAILAALRSGNER